MVDGSGLGEAIERGVDLERLDEFHVNCGVNKNRYETEDGR
jgi:hypothetical protein